MITMIVTAIEQERATAAVMRDSIVTRLDAHVTALLDLKAGILEELAERDRALLALIGGSAAGEAPDESRALAAGAAPAQD